MKKDMIERKICQVIIHGISLNPHLFTIPKSFGIVEKYKSGEPIGFGKEKGLIAKKGCLIIDGELNEMLEFILLNFKDNLIKSEIDINLNILIEYSFQCNFELTPSQLLKLSSLNINIGITCYEAD